MNIHTIHNCPLCGNSQFLKIMTCTDHYATNEIFDLFACQKCGFLFTQNVPEENEMGKYYESPNYISHTDTRKGLCGKTETGRNERNTSVCSGVPVEGKPDCV